jgi:spoIIIJ-associated protein
MSSKTLEIEGKTIDSAIKKACRDFGVPREKLNIEIISEGSSGFLGLMAKKAKIRASLLSLDMDFALETASPILKSEMKRETAGDKPAPTHEPKHEVKHEARHEAKRHEKPEAKAESRVEGKQESRPKPEHRAIKPASPAPRTRGPHPAPACSNPVEAPEATTPKPASPVAPPVTAVAASTPAALKAKELLSGILFRMSFECQVEATETDDMIILGIAGDNSGLLIGRRGQNLDAIQYILNKAVNKSDSQRKMIVVDSEEYRKRREESLLVMAERIRDKVKKTQKPLSLSHMNAHDRRIIHLALQDDELLVTKSRGEGDYRKVIVLPAKKENNSGNRKPRKRPQNRPAPPET